MKTTVSQTAVFLFLVILGISCTSLAKTVPGTNLKYKAQPHTNTTKGPPILLTNATTIKVSSNVRENAELECPFSGHKVIYEWEKDEVQIRKNWDRFSAPGNGKKLVIKSVVPEDSGIYHCRAINGFGKTNFSIQLTVTGDDPVKHNRLKPSRQNNKRSNQNGVFFRPEIALESLPTEKTVTRGKGTDLILKCEAKGNPTPNVTWSYMVKSERRNLTASSESVATLKLFNLTEKNNGKYTCTSQNLEGQTDYEFTLKVTGTWQGAAEILELNPSNLTLHPGQNGSITCMARLEDPTNHLLIWGKIVENTTESDKDDKILYYDGIHYKALHPNRTETKARGNHTYSTVLYFNNASSNVDSGDYRCAIVGSIGIAHSVSLAHVSVVASRMQNGLDDSVILAKEKSATVQRAVLCASAFIVMAVVLAVCVSRLYGCRGPLKNPNSTHPKPHTMSHHTQGVAQVSKRSPGCTLSTTLSQNQTEVLQPLVNPNDGSNSRTPSTSVSVMQPHMQPHGESCTCGENRGHHHHHQHKHFFNEHLPFSFHRENNNNIKNNNSSNSYNNPNNINVNKSSNNNCELDLESDISLSRDPTVNFIRDFDSSRYHVYEEHEPHTVLNTSPCPTPSPTPSPTPTPSLAFPYDHYSHSQSKSGGGGGTSAFYNHSRSRDRDHLWRERERDKNKKKSKKRWKRKHSIPLPSVPVPSCESASSSESCSEVHNYFHEPQRKHHQHHHYYHHTSRCPNNVSPSHLRKCVVLNK